MSATSRASIPTARRLQYARGFTALGMFREAEAELAGIADAAARASADVLAVRIDLNIEARRWKRAIAAAKRFAARWPATDKGWIGWAYALRELQQIAGAKAVLLGAEPGLAEPSALVHYNLACYHCLLGERADALRRLRAAWRLQQDWKQTALDDPDLAALRDDIAKLK